MRGLSLGLSQGMTLISLTPVILTSPRKPSHKVLQAGMKVLDVLEKKPPAARMKDFPHGMISHRKLPSMDSDSCLTEQTSNSGGGCTIAKLARIILLEARSRKPQSQCNKPKTIFSLAVVVRDILLSWLGILCFNCVTR